MAPYSGEPPSLCVLDEISVPFDRAALLEALHLEEGSDDALEFEALLVRARDVAAPKAMYYVAGVDECGDAHVVIDGVRFESRMLARNLEGLYRVFPYVVTCGVELDAVPLPGEGLLFQYWRDVIKEEALRTADEFLKDHLTRRFEPGTLTSMNPGASGTVVWDIREQRGLFSLFGDVTARTGVILTESCLMVPNKSLSGVMFPTERGFENCAVCPREKCRGRRAPYDPSFEL